MLSTILTIVQIIIAVLLTVVVTLQSGKSEGLGVVGGSSDSFMSKNKASSLDGKLAKATKWLAIVFIVVTLAVSLL